MVKCLLLISSIAMLPLIALFAQYYFRLQKIQYNFKRDINFNVKSTRRLDVKYNSYCIAGQIGGELYLGNYTTPDRMLKINTSFTDTFKVELNLNHKKLSDAGSYKLQIDSNYFYLSNGAIRSIMRGKTGVWKVEDYPIFSPYFQESVSLSDQSMVFRYISNHTNQNALRKESLSGASIENDNVLEKQVDGLFCTAGILEYNKQLNLLTYLYLYRNQILLLDTNLNLVKKISTIDPIDSAKISISTIRSNGTSALATSLLVNSNCSSWRDFLFVQSKLMGRHEDEAKFRTSVVIDIYDLRTYKYIYSLYLPNQDEVPVRQFKVLGKYIYTLSDHFINRYEVELPNYPVK